MAIDHAKEMQAIGITPSGYVRSFTFKTLTEYLGCTPNDDTDHGRFVLNDGKVLRVTFTESDDFYGFELSLGGKDGGVLLAKADAGKIFGLFLEEVLKLEVVKLMAAEDVIAPEEPEGNDNSSATTVEPGLTTADASPTPAPGDELGKQDTPVSGDSTSAPAAVDPAESASESTDSAVEVTASTETKKSKSKKSADAESAE